MREPADKDRRPREGPRQGGTKKDRTGRLARRATCPGCPVGKSLPQALLGQETSLQLGQGCESKSFPIYNATELYTEKWLKWSIL